MLRWLPIALLVACGRGGSTGDADDGGPILMSDAVLPEAYVGHKYEARLEAKGGTEPYQWAIAEHKLPDGLRLSSTDGVISGKPEAAGTYEFSVTAADIAGQIKFAQITLPVLLDPQTAACGTTISGSFGGDGVGFDGWVDWGAFDGYQWIELPYPTDDTTRIEMVFTSSSALTVYVALPNEPIGSQDVEEGYARFTVSELAGDTVTIDLGTDPALATYADQPYISVLVVANTSGPWDMEVVCTDGPIFARLNTLPTQLGEEVDVDFDIIGINTGVRIWTDDWIPEWFEWNEDTGHVTGTAMEPGGWEFTIKAEDEEGRYREELSMLGVYDVQDIACGETVDVQVEMGMYEGNFVGPYDPRGYKVMRMLDDDPTVSTVTLNLTGDDDMHIGVARPDPYFRFYADAEYIYTYTGDARLELTPRTYPHWGAYADIGEMYVIGAPLFAADPLTLEVECDHGPRPGHLGMPVLRPYLAEVVELQGIGGVEPYEFSATGLPHGVSLAGNGQFRTVNPLPSTSTIDVTITDADGATFTDTYTLYVGESEACAGYTWIDCLDFIEGSFSRPYYVESSYTLDSTEQFCIVNREQNSLYYDTHVYEGEILLSITDPGRTGDEGLYEGAVSYRNWGDSFETMYSHIDEWDWPMLPHYQDMPVIMTLQAYEEGDWDLELRCY